MSRFRSDDTTFKGGGEGTLKSIPDAGVDARIKAVRYVARQVDMSPEERLDMLEALGLVETAVEMRNGTGEAA